MIFYASAAVLYLVAGYLTTSHLHPLTGYILSLVGAMFLVLFLDGL